MPVGLLAAGRGLAFVLQGPRAGEDLPRPFLFLGQSRIRGIDVPLPVVIAATLPFLRIPETGLLLVLATHPGGCTAAELAGELLGDVSRTVTVRAELSRLRRHLGGVIAHRPYRFADRVAVQVRWPAGDDDLFEARERDVCRERELPRPVPA